VHSADVVRLEGTKKRLYVGESVEFDVKLGNGGRYRAIRVMCIGRGDSGGCQGGSGKNAQPSQPLPFTYQHLQQLPPQLHTHHKSGLCTHPFPQPFPAVYMQHPPHPMFHAQAPLACQQIPMGLQHPYMILQQHYGISPQLKKVNSVGHDGPSNVGEARSYQHGTNGNEPKSSRHKLASQGSSRQEGQPCMEYKQEMLEIEGTHISPPSRMLDLNVCSVSIPGDIMIVRGTLNLLGSSTSLGEFYDLLHTHKWYGAKAEDEHKKILLFLESAPFEVIKLYKEFEFFYQGPGHVYPVRPCE